MEVLVTDRLRWLYYFAKAMIGKTYLVNLIKILTATTDYNSG